MVGSAQDSLNWNMSITHIYDGSESPVFEGKKEDLLQSTGILDNHDPDDANYVWSVAVNIKRHIGIVKHT